MADVKLSTALADSSLGGTEELVTTEFKYILLSSVASYTIDVLAAATATSPTSGDYHLMFTGAGAEKRVDIDEVAAYAVASAWSEASATTLPTASDYVLVFQGSTTKKATLAYVTDLVLDGYQATALDISGLSAATLGATDTLLVCQSTTAMKTTLSALETKLWADYLTYVDGLSAVTAGANSDKFYVIQGGVAKYITGTVLATYMTTKIAADVLDTAWDAAAVTPAASGDVLVLQRNSVLKTATVDALITYADSVYAASSQVTPVLVDDLVYVYRSGDRKMATISAINTYMAAAEWTSDAITSALTTDVMRVQRSGVTKTLTLANLQTLMLSGTFDIPWTLIDSTCYTALPPTTSTITMSDTSDFAVGLPVRYTYNGSTYYGIVTAVASNSLVTIAGAALSTSYALTDLRVGLPQQVVNVNLSITSACWDAAVQDILATIGLQYFTWTQAAAYLVSFAVAQYTPDTGASQGKINIKIDGDLVSNFDSNLGVQASDTQGTWVTNAAVAIATANYAVERGDAIEIRCTEEGTNGNATGLTVSMTFVFA